MKNRFIILLFSLLLLCLFITGCTNQESDSYDETTISLGKKGQIKEKIVSSFDKDYYSADELKADFEETIEDYNSSATGSSATLDEIKLEDGTLYVTLDFTDSEAYKAIQNEDFFFGTISDAYDKGYSMDVTMKGTDKGDKIEKVQIMGMADKKIVIFSEPVKIKLYSDIAYVSANVDLLSDKEARSIAEKGAYAYIILDK